MLGVFPTTGRDCCETLKLTHKRTKAWFTDICLQPRHSGSRRKAIVSTLGYKVGPVSISFPLCKQTNKYRDPKKKAGEMGVLTAFEFLTFIGF